MYYYVYVLQSEKDHHLYVGFKNNIKRGLDDHNNGKVTSTKMRVPLKLIYWEGSVDRTDSTKREKYLKTAWENRYLKNRLSNYLTG
jgi:putative endonuclease